MELTRENIKSVLLDLISENLQQTRNDKKFIDAYNEYLLWAEYNLSAKTISGIRTSYNHFIGYRGNIILHEVDARFLDQFLVYVMKKAPKGFGSYIRALRAMFTKFVEWGFIPKNPFTSLKLPKQQKNEIKFFSEDEFIKLLKSESNQTLRDLYNLDFYTGLRLAEIINLDWSNVHLKESFILIGDSSFKTKARKVRRVPLCTKAIEILENRIPKLYQAKKKNYVFCKPNGFQFTGNYVSKHFKKLLRVNGYSEEYHFHSIRHSTASNLARMGVAVPMIQQILGHSNIQTTMIYTHTNFSDLVNAVSVFDNNLIKLKQKEGVK